MATILSFDSMPIVNSLKDSPLDQAKMWNLSCKSCEKCSFVRLGGGPSPDELYENYLTPSIWKNEPHIFALIESLRGLIPYDGKILDVGCNDGKFLVALRKAGFSNLYGIEPSENTRNTAISRGFEVFEGFLNNETASEIKRHTGTFDLVLARQVLEHIPDLENFGRALRSLIKEGGLLVIEVPNFGQNLTNLDFSLWEEHSNYFTQKTLAVWLESMGFDALSFHINLFSGECLTCFAQKVKLPGKSSVTLDMGSVISVKDWANSFDTLRYFVNQKISEAGPGPVVLHGVGARSSFWLNATGVSHHVSLAVDNQLAKQGKFLPKSGIPILSPEAIRDIKPSLVLLGVNTENEERVLPMWEGVAPIFSILPPSKILLWNDLLKKLS